jgi:hypothetical protein
MRVVCRRVKRETRVPVSRFVGRAVAVKVRGRARVGRLSLVAAGGEVFYDVSGVRFVAETVKLVVTSAVLPVLVLS